MLHPWRNWYHCMASTYGQWLPGDPRGFRTRHHREHIEGDYKNPPPPGKYTKRHNHAKSLLKRPPVYLPWEARVEACKRIAEALKHYNVEFIDLCVTATHFHVLARFSPYVDESVVQNPSLIVPNPSLIVPNPPTGVGGLSLAATPILIPEPQSDADAGPIHDSDIHNSDIRIDDLPWDALQQFIESAPGYFTDDDAPEHHDHPQHEHHPEDAEKSHDTPHLPDLSDPSNLPTPPQSPPTPVGGPPQPPLDHTLQNPAGLAPAHHRNDGRDPLPRYLIGKCKSWASRHVKAAGLTAAATAPSAPGRAGTAHTRSAGLFAKRGKIVPIENRRHQLATVRYIRRHVKQGAVVQSL